jgi:hypothetical protein
MSTITVSIDPGDVQSFADHVRVNPPDGPIVMHNDDDGAFIAVRHMDGGIRCQFGPGKSVA